MTHDATNVANVATLHNPAATPSPRDRVCVAFPEGRTWEETRAKLTVLRKAFPHAYLRTHGSCVTGEVYGTIVYIHDWMNGGLDEKRDLYAWKNELHLRLYSGGVFVEL